MNAPISRFSSTVSEGKTFSVWGTKQMPRRTIRSGLHPVMSVPSKRMRPAFGGSSPKIVLSRVDLPAPLGPMIVTSWPDSTVMETP
jgi:hypothetical protein